MEAQTLPSQMSSSKAMTPFDIDRLPNTQKSQSCCARFWRDGHRKALDDIRTRWRTGGMTLLAVVWSSGLCTSLAILTRLATTKDLASFTSDRLKACQPNDVSDIGPENYRYWAGSGFFQITLGYGQLSFTQAKIIDVAWDIVSTQHMYLGRPSICLFLTSLSPR